METNSELKRFGRSAWFKRSAALALAAGVVVGLAACAPASDDGGGAAGSVDAAGLAEATERLKAYQEPPTWQGPEAPVDISGLSGKRVVYISFADTIPVLNYWSTTVKQLANDYAGVQVEVIDGAFSVDNANKAFQQAIETGADAVFLQAWFADQFKAQIAEAQAAGIKVITGNTGSMEAGLVGGQDAEISFDYAEVGRLQADWFISDSQGEGKGMLVTSSDVPASQTQEDAVVAQVAALCPTCELEVEDVQIPQWETSIPTLFQSTLNSKPEITYYLPIYDGQSLSGLGALRTAGAEGIQVGSFNATNGIVQQLNDPTSALKMDIGGDNTWWAYAATDTIFRVLTDTTPIENYFIGLRVFDQSNKDLITGEDENAWYGYTGYIQEFESLWGK
jgi:ribose transport system substrate-binding protein